MERNTYLTVADIPRHFARLGGSAESPVVLADDATYSWAQIDQTASRIANLLLGSGVRPGDKVAVLLPNCGMYVPIMYGIARAGCTIVPLNSRYVAPEIAAALRLSEARALIAGAEFRDSIDASALAGDGSDARVWFVGGDAAVGPVLEQALAAADPNEPAVPEIAVDESSLYWMPFTSGTTGNAKAAMVSHRALVEHWRLVMHTFDVTSRDTMLIPGPFYHSLGFLFGLTGLFAGGRIVIHSEFDPARVMAGIEQHAATLTPMVPTMYTMILAATETHDHDVSSLRGIISAGSPLLSGTKEGLFELFPDAGLYEFYGSTETGVTTVLRPEDQRRKKRCVGQPVLGSAVRILDESGADVPPGEVGEIYKRGLLLGSEYFRSPEATAKTYRGEWAATGDLGRMDDEGYLYIVGRKKEMIISGGANIFPAEIEEVISHHPAVSEVAVIGVPDHTWGEAVKAVVVAKPDVVVTETEIIEWCRGQLANYLKPRSVDIVQQLPKTSSGKILKRVLRDQYWEDHDVQVH